MTCVFSNFILRNMNKMQTKHSLGLCEPSGMKQFSALSARASYCWRIDNKMTCLKPNPVLMHIFSIYMGRLNKFLPLS